MRSVRTGSVVVGERARSIPFAGLLAGLLAAIGAARMSVSIVPQTRFDTDPVLNPLPYAGLGPTGSLLLDVALLLVAALIFAGEARAGRRVSGVLLLLALLPAIPIAWHGASNALDLFRGATWLAAAVAGVAAAHLARDAACRAILLAGLLGGLVPLLFRGAEQILIEHGETLRAFQANKAAFFAERGWDPQGAAARTYERRLSQPEATGWFALSNIFSAAMAFGTVACGLAIVRALATRRAALSAAEERPALQLPLVPVIGSLACGAILIANGSKGAIAAAAIAFVVGGVLAWRGSLPRATLIAGGLLIAALAAPLLRGVLGESALGGERSLLFRAQYLEGAGRAFVETLPWGTGPDGFQDAYLRLKSERSPEDVQSAHAMLTDWLATLGPWTIGWMALVGAAVLRGSRRVETEDAERDSHAGSHAGAPARGAVFLAAACVALIPLAIGAMAEATILSAWWWIVRVLSAAGAFAVVLAATNAASRDPRSVTIAAWGAGLALLLQAQVEMLAFQPGFVVALALALGVLGAFATVGSPATPRRVSIASLVTASIAAMLLAFGVVPQRAQDALIDEAIAELAPVATLRAEWSVARDAMRRGQPVHSFLDRATELLDADAGAALRDASARGDPSERMSAMQAIIGDFERTQRLRAAERLLAAREALPTNWQPERAAIDQFVLASRGTTRGAAGLDVEAVSFAQALALLEGASVHWGMPRFTSLRAELLAEQVRGTAPGDGQLSERIEAARRASAIAIDLEPFNTRRWTLDGDLAAAAGDFEAAEAAWERALAVDAARTLDPLVQLSERERRSLDDRLARVRDADNRAALPPLWPLVVPSSR
jgi:hypothetical protein